MDDEATDRTVYFPKSWRPVLSPCLIRLGREFDGGYLVDKRDVLRADSLISMGISSDWSFEKEFVALNRVAVVGYDASVSGWRFFLRFLRAIFQINRPRRMAQRFLLWRDFLSFFSGNHVHRRVFVGRSGELGWMSCEDVIKTAVEAGFSSIFLKVDIEGSEYDILECLKEAEGRTVGLAIEFHNVEANTEAISRFVQSYGLKLIHIHINNFSSPGPDDIPLAIEMTFSASEQEDAGVALPHPLDMPNDPGVPDLNIAFAD